MASRGINKVILIGNIGQDPEIRYMPNGGAVANITLATSENWRDKQTGENKEKTEWHRVVLFGKLAEVAGEYLHKGSHVYIEGSLHTRKWQDQVGQDRYTTEVIVNMNGTMQMLGGGKISSNERVMSQPPGEEDRYPKQTKVHSTSDYTEPSSVDSMLSKNKKAAIDFDDDIPF